MTDPGPALVITPTDDGISVRGEIDAHTAPQVADALAAADRPELSIEMSGVDFVDSSGLRVLVEAHQRVEAGGGRLRLIDVSPAVKRLLDISGVGEYLYVE